MIISNISRNGPLRTSRLLKKQIGPRCWEKQKARKNSPGRLHPQIHVLPCWTSPSCTLQPTIERSIRWSGCWLGAHTWLTDSVDSERKTPLHYAVVNGHKQVVEKLLDARSMIHGADAEGMNALHYAADNKHGNIIALLLERSTPNFINRPLWLECIAFCSQQTRIRGDCDSAIEEEAIIGPSS